MSGRVAVSGITFLRNAVRLGYPFEESIRSALPIVDEFIVAVGEGDDATAERVRSLDDPRIRIVPTSWNLLVRRGFVYAQQTMIALYHARHPWVLSLQGDEVLHEDDLPAIRASIEVAEGDARVEALHFEYLHFYGRPDLLATGPAWYRREVRLLRNRERFVVPSDAQCYVIIDRNRRMRYPRAVASGGRVFHYGWVRPAEAHRMKIPEVSAFWTDTPVQSESYGRIDPKVLRPFTGSHPALMDRWLAEHANRDFRPDPSYRLSIRDRRHRFKAAVERLFGIDWSSRHYRPV